MDLETRGKVKPELFFPSFCRVLGERHIASVYVNNMSDLDRELMSCDEMPHILIDLVNEVYDDLDAYNIPDALTNKPTAVFNSRNVAKIIGDKKKANSHLSSAGIQMPRSRVERAKGYLATLALVPGRRLSYITVQRTWMVLDTTPNSLIQESNTTTASITR